MVTFKLPMAFCLMALIFCSCGKSNQVNSNKGSSNPSNASPASSPVLVTESGSSDQLWNQFKAKVLAGSFAAKTGTTEIYNYMGYIVNVNSSSCLWIFTCTSSKTSNNYFDREYSDSYIKHPFCPSSGACTTENIRQKLIEIVGQAYSYGQISPNKYQIYTYTGYTYVLDLSYPIVANPIARLDNQGSYYNLINVTRF